MNKVPIIISTILIITIGGAAIWLANACLGLKMSELISAEIALLGTLGALISATFVVYSHLQTNMAFRESQRPQLLIQVESQNLHASDVDSTIVPMSLLHYRNVTSNQFKDLNIDVIVYAGNREVNISHLFRRNMTMIGHDSRVRRFRPDETLQEQGINLQEIAEAGNEVVLKIKYQYNFLSKVENVDCQEYKWDPQLQQWIIP